MKALAAAILCAGTLALAVLGASWPALSRAANPQWHVGDAGAGRLAVRDGLPFLGLAGDAAERGRQAAALIGLQSEELLGIMRYNPKAAAQRNAPHLRAVLAATSADDRAELAAFAAASGQSFDALLLANATIETMCSAVVRTPDTIVARNMDFAPPGPLGQSTLVQVVRGAGPRTYAAVGWPGMIGVISGMNDAGLSACILLNWHGTEPPTGEPLALRVRHLLATCATVDEAVAAHAAASVGSAHFLLLADRSHACVAWWDGSGFHRDDPRDGWLLATNGDRQGGLPIDRRGLHLAACVAGRGTADADPGWFRRIVTASYMVGLNAQAMVFDHPHRRLELALSQGGKAAALSAWRAVDLGPLLDGQPVDSAVVQRLPPVEPLPHYLLGK